MTKMMKEIERKGRIFLICIGMILMLLALATPVSATINTDFSQCANAHMDGQTPFEGCWWIRGIDQQAKSEYYEGDVVNQRIVLEQLPSSPDGEYWLTFSHMATKGGIHGYDFITSWNDVEMINTEPVNECGDQISATAKATCQALSDQAKIDSRYYKDVNVPDDAFVSKDGSTATRIAAYEGVNGDRTIRVFSSAPITSATLSPPAHSGTKSGSGFFDTPIAAGSDSGDTYVHYRLIVESPGSTAIMVQLAGHLAITGDGTDMTWGTGDIKGKTVNLGSSGIQGGSWHFYIYDVYLGSQSDVVSLGSQDNQIQAPLIDRCAGVVCEDADLCTGPGTCDPGTGACVYEPIVCEDNNACTVGVCNPTTGCDFVQEINCDDSNACTEDTCDPGTGTCVNNDVVTDTCGDNNACTTDYCDTTSGECVNDDVVTDTCGDDSECTADSCDTVTGECVNTFDETKCTEWCGLTIGFWKNNVNKYVSGTTNGRQVCDEFFENNDPGFSCDSTSDCSTWTCINTNFQAKDQTASQMIALSLTNQYHVIPEGVGPFVINCAEIPCSASLNACQESTYPLMSTVLDEIENLAVTNPSQAASLANCLNNYNDAQCSDNVDYANCDSGSFEGLTGCLKGAAPKTITMRLS